MYFYALRFIKRTMNFGFGESLFPNVGGLRQFFEHDPFFGYVFCRQNFAKLDLLEPSFMYIKYCFLYAKISY